MPRIASPYILKPVMQYSFMVHSSKLPGVQLYGKAATLPTVLNSAVRVDYQNSHIKVKGKTEWEDITIECYHFEGMTAIGLWAYMQGHQVVAGAIDSGTLAYKHDMQIWLLNPMQAPIGKWKLKGAFFNSVNWGNMDWAGGDINKCIITIAYDYAEYGGL